MFKPFWEPDKGFMITRIRRNFKTKYVQEFQWTEFTLKILLNSIANLNKTLPLKWGFERDPSVSTGSRKFRDKDSGATLIRPLPQVGKALHRGYLLSKNIGTDQCQTCLFMFGRCIWKMVYLLFCVKYSAPFKEHKLKHHIMSRWMRTAWAAEENIDVVLLAVNQQLIVKVTWYCYCSKIHLKEFSSVIENSFGHLRDHTVYMMIIITCRRSKAPTWRSQYHKLLFRNLTVLALLFPSPTHLLRAVQQYLRRASL